MLSLHGELTSISAHMQRTVAAPKLTNIFIHMQNDVSHRVLTSMSTHMQSAVSAPRADEYLGSHAECCLCTESWRASRFTCRALSLHRELTSISIHIQSAILHRDLTSISAHMQSTELHRDLTSTWIHMQIGVSAPRADEHLDSHAECCLCTES